MSSSASSTRKHRLSELHQQAERRRRLTWLAIAAGVVLIVGALAYLVWQESQPVTLTGVSVPVLESPHVPVGQVVTTYNSDPPTSGPHYDVPAEAGFYDAAPTDEQLVHNLEHGHVIIWYNCTDLSEADCTALKSQIREVMGAAGASAITGTSKVVAAPRPALDSQFALTAWGRLDKFDGFDRQRILNFIRLFRDQAPEPGAP